MLRCGHIIALQAVAGLGRADILRLLSREGTGSIRTCTEFFSLVQHAVRRRTVTREETDRAVAFAAHVLKDAEARGIGVLGLTDEAFPRAMLHAAGVSGRPEPPLVLYYRGALEAMSLPGVAVVGTRRPTPEGVQDGEYYGAALAGAGCNVISGLALGCDAAAHRGALSCRGTTTAFLAHGLDSVYPKEHAALAGAILDGGGLLMSEYPAGTAALPRHFVARNRLQVALTRATLVIQAGKKGGTCHTGRMTLAAKKPLFCVHCDAAGGDVCAGNEALVQAGGREVGRRDAQKVLNAVRAQKG